MMVYNYNLRNNVKANTDRPPFIITRALALHIVPIAYLGPHTLRYLFCELVCDRSSVEVKMKWNTRISF
jgi:hypothetical protein